MILLMSVEPGFGGQSYIPGSTEKIKKLRTMLDDRGLKTDIEIDGGVGLGNIREVLDAGCNIVVAGSAVFKGDIAESAGKFNKVLEDYQL
jgi:ribulose-phosphate 3-epimerase